MGNLLRGRKVSQNHALLTSLPHLLATILISPTGSWSGLFINASVPLLVPLFATNPSSVVRMYGYGLLPWNPLQKEVRRNHRGDL